MTRIRSISVNDVLLLASSECALEHFAAECEIARMRFSMVECSYFVRRNR